MSLEIYNFKIKIIKTKLSLNMNNGEETSNEHEKAEKLNKFFYSVFVEEVVTNVPLMGD